ncbi:MAG: hypothetical protein ABIT08_17825 [Bacteroidia bacterium]
MLKTLANSKTLLFIIILFTTVCSFKNERWKTGSIIQNDVIFYYSYLPATFIYHDLTFGFVRNLPGEIQAKIYTPFNEDNLVVQKMTSGVAVLLLPFFLIAHFYSILSSLPANGYTEVYEFSIAAAALFYFAIGLIFLRKILKKNFNEWTIALTLMVIALCTNLFYYTSYESGMSHVYSFCLFSIFLWHTIKWHEKPVVLNSFLTGIILGMIILVRPTNCVIFIFFILYSITDKKSILNKFRFIKENGLNMTIIFASVFIPLSIQLIYWKYVSGHWVCYSYGDQRFFFNNPHIWLGLLGFRKGFFIYAPAMLMIIPGFWMALKEHKIFGLGVIVFFIVNVYVIFSWWSWWYGGSFGSRPLIDSFPVLALPLGTFIEKFTTGKQLKKNILITCVIIFTTLNLFQTEQAKSTLLHWEGMNVTLYFKIFGTRTWPDNYDLMVTPADADKALKGLPERDVFDLSVNNLKLLYTCKVNIKGANNKFVCADANNDGLIICNRDQPYEWETFLMRKYFGNVCTLQSSQGKFLGITSENDSPLRAHKEIPEKTEIFKIIDLDNHKFALKSCNGSLITLKKKQPELLTSGVYEINNSESFELISQCDSAKNSN